MTTNSADKPKRNFKLIFLTSALVIIIGVIALQIGWVLSGSNEWKLVKDENGVKIYSMKTPGTGLNKYKGVVNVHSSVSTLVALMTDPDLCDDVGCYARKVLGQVDDPDLFTQYSVSRFNYPFNMKPREFVTIESYSEDRANKVVTYEVTAAANKTPLDNCCIRVTHMDNIWLFKPLQNGEVSIEYYMDMDEGGLVPDFFKNYIHPTFITGFLGYMQSLVDKETKKNTVPKFKFFAD